MRRAASLTVAVLGALSGCSLSPRYQRPSVPAAPDAYKEAGEGKPATPADGRPPGRWWSVFPYQAFGDRESPVTAATQSLRAAPARLSQARDEPRVASGVCFP